jgi:chromosome segregation ATPase
MTPLNNCFRIAELEKKIKELNDQIRVYKNELSDKQKEFAQEKADLQTVIDQMKMGGEQVGHHHDINATFTPSPSPSQAANAEADKLKKDLEKAQKEIKEGAVERERFQAQLEMLVTELEQKQVLCSSVFSHIARITLLGNLRQIFLCSL